VFITFVQQTLVQYSVGAYTYIQKDFLFHEGGKNKKHYGEVQAVINYLRIIRFFIHFSMRICTVERIIYLFQLVIHNVH
jgi:hypothetical protein